MSSLIAKMVCSGSGGLMIFVAPIMNLINFTNIGTWLVIQIIFWLAIFLPLYKHTPFFLNSKDNINKDIGRTIGFTLAIYYAAMVPIVFIIRRIFCSTIGGGGDGSSDSFVDSADTD